MHSLVHYRTIIYHLRSHDHHVMVYKLKQNSNKGYDDNNNVYATVVHTKRERLQEVVNIRQHSRFYVYLCYEVLSIHFCKKKITEHTLH